MKRKPAKQVIKLSILFAFISASALLPDKAVMAMPPADRMELSNKLVVIILEEHSLPFLTFELLVNAGSKHDPAGLEGLANITANGLLLGTRRHSATVMNEELDFIGSTLNAECNQDYATLDMRVLKKDLDKGFSLFWEAVTEPAFSSEEIQREVEKTLGSIRSSEDQPSKVAQKAFQKALFGSGPYGHPVEGWEESLAKVTREAVAEFYKTRYRPNNSILVIAGDITVKEVKDKLAQRLQTWPAGDVPGTPGPSAFTEGPETVSINRPITQANVILGHKGVSRDNKDYYALSVMNNILGGGDFLSRMVEEVRVRRGLAYAISSFFIPRKHSGMFEVMFQTQSSSTREAISLVQKEMKRIQTEPVSDEEMETARKYLIGSFPLRFDTQKDLAEFYAQVEYYGLGLDYPQRYPSFIESVTREDVLRVAKTYLHPDACILVVVGNLEEINLQ